MQTQALTDAFAPKTRKVLAAADGISTKTLYRWMKKLGLPTDRKLLTEKCLRVLYKEHGNPYHK